MDLKYFGILQKVGTKSKPKLLPYIYDDYDSAFNAMCTLVSLLAEAGLPESVSLGTYMVVEIECHRYV